ncbi:MAG: isochorismatase family protein [Spirochaetales bacterium]|nr:isochorismatase family protein [Spirochaetales bacterium]
MEEKYALLVIDVQKGIFKKKTKLYKENTLIENINKLIKHTRKTSNYVVIIQHCSKSFLKKSTPDWEIHQDIDYDTNDIRIEKEHGDSFIGTSLKTELNTLNINQVLICGLVSHGCVKATCMGAIENGFKAILVSDGHSNYNKDAGKIIEEVNSEIKKLIDVKTTGEIVSI